MRILPLLLRLLLCAALAFNGAGIAGARVQVHHDGARESVAVTMQADCHAAPAASTHGLHDAPDSTAGAGHDGSGDCCDNADMDCDCACTALATPLLLAATSLVALPSRQQGGVHRAGDRAPPPLRVHVRPPIG